MTTSEGNLGQIEMLNDVELLGIIGGQAPVYSGSWTSGPEQAPSEVLSLNFSKIDYRNIPSHDQGQRPDMSTGWDISAHNFDY
jgi:hypothetical protein